MILQPLQGRPSGRGQALVDIEIRVTLQNKKFFLWRNFPFDVNKLSFATKWTTLYIAEQDLIISADRKSHVRQCLGFFQLIHRPTRTKNQLQLYKNPNIT